MERTTAKSLVSRIYPDAFEAMRPAKLAGKQMTTQVGDGQTKRFTAPQIRRYFFCRILLS
jgi:hypothetical protein